MFQAGSDAAHCSLSFSLGHGVDLYMPVHVVYTCTRICISLGLLCAHESRAPIDLYMRRYTTEDKHVRIGTESICPYTQAYVHTYTSTYSHTAHRSIACALYTCLCLSGRLEVEAFNLQERRSAGGALLLERVVQRELGPGDHCTLTATYGNIHSVRARTFTQLLDVFTPPYDEERLTRYRWYKRADAPYEGDALFEAWES